MSKRDEIAELLAAQEVARWDQLPQSENVEDRRPRDPIEAYVKPEPFKLEGSYQPRSWMDVVEHEPVTHGMNYPGPYDPFGMQLDPDRMALDAMTEEPQPEHPAVREPLPDTRIHDVLRTMQVFEAGPRESGHLGYLNTMPVGSKYYLGDPPNPYVRRKSGEQR